MSEKLPKTILDRLSPEESTRYKLYHNAVVQNLRAYNDSPTSAKKKDLDSADAAFAELAAELAERYREPGAADSAERFKSRKAALDWLQAQGYQVSNGKFYKDCAAGELAMGKDGSLSRYRVLLYGLKLAKGGGPSVDAVSTAEDDARKAKADADMAEMKAERMRREEDKLWLHADQAWAAVAGLIGALRDALRYHLHLSAREIVLSAGGDQERSHEMYELVEEVVSRGFNDVAGASIAVEFSKEQDDGREDEGHAEA